jgi:HSP20 family protein
MKQNSKEISFEFDLPGFSKDDIKVSLSKNAILLKAEKQDEKEIKKKDYFHQEKVYRNFVYSSTLPDVKPKEAKKSFKKGVFKIVIPKK